MFEPSFKNIDDVALTGDDLTGFVNGKLFPSFPSLMAFKAASAGRS